MAGEYHLHKSRRIRRNAEYKYVYRRGKSTALPVMAVVVAKGRGQGRAGFSAGKKYGNSVARNRAKRLMRESYRLIAAHIKPGTLIVFIARKQMLGASFDNVHAAMIKLLSNLGCFRDGFDENNAHFSDKRV